MKRKFRSMGRVAIALVLALSLTLVMAVPVAAEVTAITYTNLTSLDQRIAKSSDPTALFRVDITAAGGEELSKVIVQFESITNFAAGDLETDGVSVYSDVALATEIATEDISWVGLIATVTLTTPVTLNAGVNEFWVAIQTSTAIGDEDQFRATLDTTSLEIDSLPEGATSSKTTYTITADATPPSFTVEGSTLGDDKIILTFNEDVAAADGWANAFTSIDSPNDGTPVILDHASFVYDDADPFTLTITLNYAEDGEYLVNSEVVAVTPVEDAILDMVGQAVPTDEKTDTVGGDSRLPMVAEEDIVGTITAGDDTIAITFSEDTRGDWTGDAAVSIDKDDFTAIKSPHDGSGLTLTNAGFDYSPDTFTLVITLNYADDEAYLINGDFVLVDPIAANLTDMAGNLIVDDPVTGTTPNSGDLGAPVISTWVFEVDSATYDLVDGRPLKSGDSLDMTIIFSEAMADKPKVETTDMTMVVDTGRTEWIYTHAAGLGNDEVTITASGTDMAGNALAVDVERTYTEDNAPPTIAPADIIGAVLAGNDTITITFSDDTRGDWDAAVADSIVLGDLAIESPDTNPLALTNAGFVYVAATKTLTITLDFADDGDYLVNGDDVEVTPTTALTDMAGNTMATAAVTGTTLIGAIVLSEVWVDDDGTAGWEAIPTNFLTIAEGINAVAPGGTVYVAAGTYAEDFDNLITKSVTLSGPNAAISPNTGIRMDEAIIEPTDYDNPGILLKANDITVEGFKVDMKSALQDGIVIEYDTQGVTVQNNIIIGAGWSGIALSYDYADGSGVDKIVDGAIVSDNNITGCGAEGGGVSTGISMSGCTKDCMISNNTITGCGANGRGISFNGGTLADPTQGNTITGNTIIDNACMGIFVKKNVVEESPPYFDNNLIEKNTISGNALAGIRIEDGLTITGLTIENNNILGNDAAADGYGIENLMTGVSVNAEENWWGSNIASEIEAMLSTGGDPAVINVTYSPWLDAAYPGGLPTTSTNTIDLEAGWNFISVPRTMAADTDTFTELLGGIDYTVVWSYDPYTTDGWVQITTGNEDVEVLEGYWINVDTAGTVTLSYTEEGKTVPPTKELKGNAWNAIGPSSTVAKDAALTLKSIEGSWSTLIAWNAETQSYEEAIIAPAVGQLAAADMAPGKGYWLWVTQDDMLSAISG